MLMRMMRLMAWITWEGSCQHQDEDEVNVAVEDNHDEDDSLDHG